MARNLNLSIDAGASFSVNMPAVKDASGIVINLTGYTVAATMKKSYVTTTGTDFTTTVTLPTNGIITLALDSSDTTGLVSGQYVYDVLITDVSDISTRVFEGTVTVRSGVTSLTPSPRQEPATRDQHILWCKRQLGYPVLEINMEDDQMQDLVDQSLQTYREYHYDATQRTYLKHQVTQTDINNEFIPCDNSIATVVRAIKFQESSINLFDLRYQLRLQDFYNFTNVSMVHYEITQEKLALLDWMLTPEPIISFTRHEGRIHINLDWKKNVRLGDFIVFEVYQTIDPDAFTNMWNDKWLKAFTTALFKQQWGANMKKFYGTQLVGGTQLNGQQLFDEATKDIDRLEEQLHNQYQAPMRMFMG